jgi:DNA mismatch repair protein MutL
VNSIRILPDDLVDQIAAGEVVERPASVVKELIENALDAGARTLTIEIEAGGVALIRITDDGRGMSRDDAQLAIKRHATSKIHSIDDLSRIATLGFRGEALPSIASVSRFTLRSRDAHSESATELRIDGGELKGVHEIGSAKGTTVEVRDLFYNVPARRKFLKSTATESAQVGDVCMRAALGDAGLRLVLHRDGKRAKELLPCTDVSQRARMLFADDALSAVEGSRDGLEVRAMLSPPERARSGATQLHVYVNGRPVRDRALSRAIAFGYGSLLSGGKYPVGALWLTVDPARVDVNVHPQKAEVRFANSRDVLDALTRIVASSLGNSAFRGPGRTPNEPATTDEAPVAFLKRDPGFWDDRLGGGMASRQEASQGEAARNAVPYPLADVNVAGVPFAEDAFAVPEPLDLRVMDVLRDASGDPLTQTSRLRFVAQVRKMFLLCESDRGLVILDQHAADERVRFDRLTRAHRARNVPSQRLLLPERVELAASDVALLDESEDAIAALGLELAAIGETTIAVRAVPALVSRASPGALVRDLVAELGRDGARAFGDRVDRVLATMACHGSVRGGDRLSPQEAEALLRSLDTVEHFAGHCPHGRPILYELPWPELERRVGR